MIANVRIALLVAWLAVVAHFGGRPPTTPQRSARAAKPRRADGRRCADGPQHTARTHTCVDNEDAVGEGWPQGRRSAVRGGSPRKQQRHHRRYPTTTQHDAASATQTPLSSRSQHAGRASCESGGPSAPRRVLVNPSPLIEKRHSASIFLGRLQQ